MGRKKIIDVCKGSGWKWKAGTGVQSANTCEGLNIIAYPLKIFCSISADRSVFQPHRVECCFWLVAIFCSNPSPINAVKFMPMWHADAVQTLPHGCRTETLNINLSVNCTFRVKFGLSLLILSSCSVFWCEVMIMKRSSVLRYSYESLPSGNSFFPVLPVMETVRKLIRSFGNILTFISCRISILRNVKVYNVA